MDQVGWQVEYHVRRRVVGQVRDQVGKQVWGKGLGQIWREKKLDTIEKMLYIKK